MVVPRAQLKVFVPLDALPAEERERWRSYVTSGGGLSRAEAADLEARVSTARLLTGRAPVLPELALVRRAGSRVLLCPLELELRAATALAAFRRNVPAAVADAFVPDRETRERLDELYLSGPAPHVLDEAWVVPIPWFVAYAPNDRRYLDPPEGAGPRVVYLATGEQAVARLTRAIDILESRLDDAETIVSTLVGMASWLEGFEPSAIVELDYGPVARLFAPEELRADRSCEEVWRAIGALADGDTSAALAAYGRVRDRWSRLQAKRDAS